MGWQQQKGKEVLGSIEVIQGIIQIKTNEGGTPTEIKRVEAYDAERILGVRCGLN